MEKVQFDFEKKYGKFKILNATNGGPWCNRKSTDQLSTNFADYKAVGFPYSRNHDSASFGVYGGPYSHDITNIFPNFDADVNDPESYDFACTDESILVCLEAGTETFFRLGQTIEHQIKKHGTIPPKDFKKWAEICEHIIRHYNEGWADGFNLNIQYWEIWNEANLDADDSDNKRCWGGTTEQFYDLYEIASKHLKKCFPNLKIGGPAYAGYAPYGNTSWLDEFLCEMKKRNVEFDFVSWHLYAARPETIVKLGESVKELMLKYGYDKAESICNEWNYVKGWVDEFIYSIEMIHGLKNAAFITAMMSLSQKSSIDMLMYYDTRPSVFNGIFDYYTNRPLKGYYPMLWYRNFYELENEIRQSNEVDNIYSLCGEDKDGRITAMLTYYTDDDNAENKKILVDLPKDREYEVFLLDNEHDGKEYVVKNNLEFDMEVHTCILIKEKL